MKNSSLKPWETKAVAALAAAVMVLISIFGLGTLGLHNLRQSAVKTYTAADKYGNSMQADFTARVSAAANLVSLGKTVLGADNELVQAANGAVDDATKAKTIATVCKVNSSLSASVDMLYQQMSLTLRQGSENADSEKAATAQTQWGEFLSRNDLMLKGDYPAKADTYNNARSGFPAVMLCAMFGLEELPALA